MTDPNWEERLALSLVLWGCVGAALFVYVLSADDRGKARYKSLWPRVVFAFPWAVFILLLLAQNQPLAIFRQLAVFWSPIVVITAIIGFAYSRISAGGRLVLEDPPLAEVPQSESRTSAGTTPATRESPPTRTEGESAVVHLSPPVFERVRVQTVLLQVLIVLWMLGAGFSSSGRFVVAIADLAMSSPVSTGIVALLLFLWAVRLGAVRQLSSALLWGAVAVPTVDDQGKEAFVYLGVVPSPRWIHSALYRSLTWAVVVVASAASGVLAGLVVEAMNWKGGWVFVLPGTLVVRWAISFRIARTTMNDLMSAPL